MSHRGVDGTAEPLGGPALPDGGHSLGSLLQAPRRGGRTFAHPAGPLGETRLLGFICPQRFRQQRRVWPQMASHLDFPPWTALAAPQTDVRVLPPALGPSQGFEVARPAPLFTGHQQRCGCKSHLSSIVPGLCGASSKGKRLCCLGNHRAA